jgi:hypothetical protein
VHLELQERVEMRSLGYCTVMLQAISDLVKAKEDKRSRKSGNIGPRSALRLILARRLLINTST